MKKLLTHFICCFIILMSLSVCGKIFAWIDTETDQDSICDFSQPAPENRINISEEKNLTPPSQKIKYHPIPIVVIATILYIFTSILSKKKIIKLATHRKIWNFMLLISFFISSILGTLLIAQINSALKFSLPFNLLFWHAEIGIAAFIIGVFHIIWHWKYFKNVFK